MQWMRWVMRNRLRFGAQHFGAGKSGAQAVESAEHPVGLPLGHLRFSN
jgi:hypothetical protein